jgi:isopentenyl diphosphate isomerase/L-lactate dehydrogenase-like FMN-dependent dehydrogenase
LDTTPATISVLPEIVDCGARTVFIGAEAGVRYVLEMVRQEFESAADNAVIHDL